MPGQRLFFRLALPLRPHPPVLRIVPTIASLAPPATYRSFSNDPNDFHSSELRTLPSVLTERLDKHDQYPEKLDRQFERLNESITELKMEV